MIHTNVDQAFVAALVAFVVALVSAPFVYRALVRTQVRQKVSEHVPEHAAKQGTPTMGGIIVLLGLAGAFWFVPRGEVFTPLVLVAGFALIGFLDDFIVPRLATGTRGLGWKQKFLLQVVVCATAFYFDGYTEVFGLACVVFIVMFFANAFNFADGMDTLAGGLAVMIAIGLIMIARLSYFAPDKELALLVLMGGLAASFLPFLFYNAPPAKVFMGDVGALPVGALLGWTLLQTALGTDYIPYIEQPICVALISLVLVAELVPVPLQILSVKLRKGKRLFPRTPIHHAFQHAGWPETRVVWMFHLVQAVLVAVAVGVLWRVAG